MKELGIAEYDNHVAFWPGAFSNFYKCSFEFDGKTWDSSEQCFMAMKAKHFGDDNIYKKILSSKTPKEAKELGRLVKNYDDNEWSSIREKIMYDIVYEKFSQNKNLRDLILKEEYKNKNFVEGSPYDTVWGAGILYLDERIDNEENWNGKNLLGKVLNKVRMSLKH